MSTSWDLHCPEHKDWANLDWKHGEDQLALLWRRREQLFALLDAAGEIFDVEIELDGYLKVSTAAQQFLRLHTHCRLELVNEYRDRQDVASREKLPPKHCATCSCPPR